MEHKLFQRLAVLAFCYLSVAFNSLGSGSAAFQRKQAAQNTFRAHCDLYGFEISDKWEPYGMSDFQTPFYQFDDSGHPQFRTDIQQVLLKHVDSSDTFAFAYRVVQSPISKSRDWGFMGIGSYGDNWYCSSVRTVIDFPSYCQIGSWAPKNLPTNYSGTIGVSAGTGGFQISANVNYASQSVTIESSTNVATRHFEAYYHSTELNNASHSSMDFYGFVTFQAKISKPSITVKHTTGYYGADYHGEAFDDMVYSY